MALLDFLWMQQLADLSARGLDKLQISQVAL